MQPIHNILLAFYGDDLTGSTDALEFICTAGANALLFLDPPDVNDLERYPGLQAYGVAGLTRSLPPEKMEEVLVRVFQTMKSTGAKHVHYKVCSTFDSSPTVGSIGKAIDIGANVFHSKPTPVIGGTPALGRFCVFGHLFARMGIGTAGKIFRLDRHPSMSRHPVTPSTESDLRVHLGSQTAKKIGLIDLTRMELELEKWKDAIDEGDEIVLLDALTVEQLEKIGEWLEVQTASGQTLFSAGSSAVEMALGLYWKSKGLLEEKNFDYHPTSQAPLLVLSGSCSPVTTKQIDYALKHGFLELPLKMKQDRFVDGNDNYLDDDVSIVANALRNNKNVIVHTGKIDGSTQPSSADFLGTLLGKIAAKVAEQFSLKRLVIAGGDTSSYAARAMGVEALEMIAPFVSGAPLCRVHSANNHIDGMEINLKGGQVGGEGYFVQIQNI